MKIPVQRVNN